MRTARPLKARTPVAAVLALAALLAVQQASAEGLARELLAFLGISATPGQMKGPSNAAAAGDIWVVDLRNDARRQLTHDGRWRWPVFDPAGGRLLALASETIASIPVSGGAPQPLRDIKGIVKLVGFDRASPDNLLIVREGEPGQPEIGVLSLAGGQITPIDYDPASPDDRRLLAHLLGEERVYGDVRLYLKKETETTLTGSSIEWTDVYLKQDQAAPRDVSRCSRADCGQPSLSLDGMQVAFIARGRK